MVTEEKILVKKIRHSFKTGQSRADITRRLQERGCKLEYIDKLISKSKRPKYLFIGFSILLIIILFIGFAAYSFLIPKNKILLINPLEELKSESLSKGNESVINFDEINITSEFPTYVLSQIGVEELHKNPLTFEDPIINLEVDGECFYSVINKGIKSFEGVSEESDVIISISKEDIVLAILSDEPEELIRSSFIEGRANIEFIADNAELFAKGYLSMYNHLQE